MSANQIDLHSGQAAFSLPLASLPGRNGLGVDISAGYNSQVQKQAITWNTEAPTGLVGLGWAIPFEAIYADANGCANPNDRRYFLVSSGHVSRLVRTGTGINGSLLYAREDYAFQLISYSPSSETWTIIRENGDTCIYGGLTSGRNTVQLNVHWDNWAGSSNQTQDQRQGVIGWNLNQVTNRFNDTITYQYMNVNVPVGSATGSVYTQASYPARITGVEGDYLVFNYSSKNALEYQDPHITPVPPNAYQDRFETNYLSSIGVFSPQGTLKYTTQLSYTNPDGSTAFLGTGSLSKRLLTDISTLYPDAPGSLPGTQFSYYGQNVADGVNNFDVFNCGTQALYGAINTVTVPTGGITIYRYGSLSPAFSNRQTNLPAPILSGVVFSNPVFYFQDDYTLVTWYGDNNTAHLFVYTWAGRWILQDLGSVPVATITAYGALQVSLSDFFFAVYAQNQVHLYQADPANAGNWIQPAVGSSPVLTYFTTAFTAVETVVLVTGDRFAAVLGETSGTLYRYNWNGISWQATTLATPAGTATNLTWALAGDNNYILAVYTSLSTTTDPLHIYLSYLDETGAWSTAASFTRTRPFSSIGSLTLWPEKTFVAVRVTSSTGGQNTADYHVWRWNESFSSLHHTDLGTINSGSAASADLLVKGNTIALGQQFFRYDGAEWNSQAVGTLDPAGAGTILSLTLGIDQAVRVLQLPGGNFLSDVLVFNPNIGAGTGWNIPTGLSATGATAGISLAAKVGHTPCNFVLFNNQLYYCDNTGTWNVFNFTLPALTGNDALSVSLLSSNYLVFQQNGTILVYPLLNGGIQEPGTAITLINQQSYAPGLTLTGQHAFVSYTGTWGSAGSLLNLNRVIGNAIAGLQTAYTVVSIDNYNGYQHLYTAYSYDNTSAVSSNNGYHGSFLRILSVAGQPLPALPANGWVESYYYNGLTTAESLSAGIVYPSGNGANAASYSSIAAGALYAQKTFPAGAAAGANDSGLTIYQIIYPVPLGTNGQGFYARAIRTERIVDSVTSISTAVYSALTGLITASTDYNYNSLGQAEQNSTGYTYFWEIYDTSRTLNLLTPTILTQKNNTIGSVVTPVSSLATVYQGDWGHGSGQWAPVGYYQAQSATAPPFTSWFPASTAPGQGWLLLTGILTLDSYGQVLRAKDTLGNTSSMLYDTDSLFSVAQFGNADIASDEACYYGFMPYEDPQGWAWSGTGSPLSANITTTDFHTGSQCLLLPPVPSVSSGPVRSFQPATQNRAYVFGAWVKSATAFDPSAGAAQIKITVSNLSGNAVLQTYTLAIPNTNGQWAYLQQVINLPAILSASGLPASTILYLTIFAYNLNASQNCLIDDLRFSPTEGSFGATVYDAANRLVTATLGNNGETSRLVYDAYNRVLATVGPQESVQSLSAFSFSRDLTSLDSFQSAYPNSVLQLSTTSQSLYYDFHNSYPSASGTGSAWAYSGDSQASWAITGGALTFTGTSSTPLGSRATLGVFGFTNFAVQVYIPSHSGNVGISNGELVAYWDAAANSGAGTWTLARYSQSNNVVTLTPIYSSSVVGFGNYLIFAVVDNLLLFFVNGTQVFSYSITNSDSTLPQYGFPSLLVNQAASFDDMVVLNDPQLSIGFIDGFGNTLQQLSLEGYVGQGTADQTGYRSVSTGVFTDGLGRPQYARNPALPALAINAANYLITGNQYTYLVDASGQQETLQQYLAGTAGFAYTAINYEPSPLSRETSLVLPRESGQPAANFTISLTNGPANNTVVPSTILPAAVLGNYFMNCTTDQNGVSTYSVEDQAGNPIAQLTDTGNSIFNITANIYDTSGRVVTKRMPNYFDPPAGSQAASWQEIMTYTYTGQLSSIQTPDKGTAYFIYDNSSRLRLVMDASGAVATINSSVCQQILYYKYDNLGRVIEQGYIQDPAWQWGAAGTALQQMAGTTGWPAIGDGTGGTVQGKWTKAYSYDFDPAGLNTAFQLGRLWQTSINNNASPSNPDTETRLYDAQGNVTMITTLVNAYDSLARITEYTYNNQGQITGIYYPYTTGNRNQAFTVGYYYNRLGQMASIGNLLSGTEIIDPSHPSSAGEARYASYQYNPDGTLASQSFNNHTESGNPGTINYGFSRNSSYNDAGWLTETDDPYCTENLSYYEDPGYNGTTYYNGNIAKTGFSYKQTIDALMAPTQYTYGYDKLNRLTAAQNTLGSPFGLFLGKDATLSPPSPAIAGYDANGNILNQQRGSMTNTFNYGQSAGNTTVTNNRLLNSTGTADNTLNITGQPAPGINYQGDWSWGNNNGGPSASTVTDRTGGGGKCLQLAGGSLGHYECLQIDTFLSAAGNYSLTYGYATAAGFPGPGDAGWYLSVQSASGTFAEIPLQRISDSNGIWVTASIASINLPSILASLGIGESTVMITLQLRNGKQPVSGTGTGVYLQVNGVTLSSVATVNAGNNSYDANGNIIQSVARGINNLSYDPVSGLPISLNTGTSAGLLAALSYGSNDQRVLEKISIGSTTLQQKLYIHGGSDYPLAEMQTINGQPQTIHYIYGPDGLVATENNGNFQFILKDHLGSTRMVLDNHNNVVGINDYLPFGGSIRQQGQGSIPYLYTGQEFDSFSGLYNYRARFYDTETGRFYAADPVAGTGSPYAYGNNNPVSFVDADGRIPLLAPILTGLAAGAALLISVARRAGTYGRNNPRKALLAGAALTAYHQSNSTMEFARNTATDIAINVISANTIFRLLHVLEANIAVNNRVFTYMLGGLTLGTEGAIKGRIRRWWYNDPNDSPYVNIIDTPVLRFSLKEHWIKDGISNVASYFMFQSADLRDAISPRTTVGNPAEGFYLKFANDWSQWNTIAFWKALTILPYKGKTGGDQGSVVYLAHYRHVRHEWNPYGYGPWFLVAISRDADAIDFLERASIMYGGRAARLTDGTLQQSWNPWTVLSAPHYQNFKAEFLYWHLNYGLHHFNISLPFNITLPFLNITVP
ncbi:RHS repeat-associated core domain-containing protein [Flavitalea flava]